MPIDYKKYVFNWKTEIRPKALLAADNCCQKCGVRNYSLVRWDKKENGWEHACGNYYLDELGTGEGSYKDARICADFWNENDEDPRWIVIVLTIAHLNHDTSNNRPQNLKALCQRHHLQIDADLHRQNAKHTRNKKKGLQNLF